MMIFRNKKGLSFVEIIMSIAVISIVILGSAMAIKFITKSFMNDRQEIQGNNLSQAVIDELKENCTPEIFIILKEQFETNDWEKNITGESQFPALRANVGISDDDEKGQREVTVTIYHRASNKEILKNHIVFVNVEQFIQKALKNG